MASKGLVRRALGAIVAMGSSALALGAHAADLSATATEPRAYGYHVGDVVTRSVTIHVPAGLALDTASLPQPGARGKALELRRIETDTAPEAGGTRHELSLDYQIFLSPPEVRTLEIAPIVLRFKGTPRDQDLRIEAWPLSVAPLAAAEAPQRRGLGDLRPDLPPPAIDTQAVRVRLLAWSAGLLLVLAYLAHVYIGPWWSTRQQRPFAQAWRALGRWPAGEPRAAFQRVHEALNQAAGEVVFEHGIDRFIAREPRYAPLRSELAAFFERSRQEFFAEAASEGDRVGWLRAFCRQLRDAERGSS